MYAMHKENYPGGEPGPDHGTSIQGATATLLMVLSLAAQGTHNHFRDSLGGGARVLQAPVPRICLQRRLALQSVQCRDLRPPRAAAAEALAQQPRAPASLLSPPE